MPRPYRLLGLDQAGAAKFTGRCRLERGEDSLWLHRARDHGVYVLSSDIEFDQPPTPCSANRSECRFDHRSHRRLNPLCSVRHQAQLPLSPEVVSGEGDIAQCVVARVFGAADIAVKP